MQTLNRSTQKAYQTITNTMDHDSTFAHFRLISALIPSTSHTIICQVVV